MSRLRSKLYAASVYVAIVLMATTGLTPADAGAQYYGGMSANRGYFNSDNRISATENDSVLPAHSNAGGGECYYTYETGIGKYAIPNHPDSRNHALPRDLAAGPNGNDKQKYRDYLYAQYHSDRCHNKTTFGHPSARTHRNWTRDGVTFIVRTMLGHPPGSSRTLSNADWREFDEKIVNNPEIRMNYHSASNPTINSRSYGYGRFPHPKTNVRDIGFYTSSGTPPVDEVYRFTSTSGYRYEIKLRCANPAGVINTNIPTPNKWSLSGETTVDKTVAKPGDTVTWTHTVTNDGPDATTEKIVSNSRRSMDGSTHHRGETPSGQTRGRLRQFTSSLEITTAHAGQEVCERVQWDPTDSDGGANGYVDYVCVDVYAYTLTPELEDMVSVVEPGAEDIKAQPYVTNGGPTDSLDTQWQLTRFTLPPSYTNTVSGGDNGSNPCVHFSVGDNCESIDDATNVVFNINPARTDLPVHDASIGDLEPGTRICFALSLQPYSATSGNDWRHSDPQCVTIGKKPKVQVLGGDLMADGQVKASKSTKTHGTYGSWGEYAVLAKSAVSGFASAATLADTTPGSNLNLLTFTNNSATPGDYNPANYWNRNWALSLTPDRLSSSSIHSFNSSVTVPGSHIPTPVNYGQSIIIASTETVTINNDIRYRNDPANPLTSITQIPQVVIMAKNINITNSVEHIDAWLIAPEGFINTCSDYGVTENLTIDRCDNELVINGPVVADELYLRRTAGSGSGDDSGVPAETINLRADAYLWAYLRADISNSAQTVFTTEMAPRF